MKRKTLILSIVVLMTLLFISNSYALTTRAVIHLRMRVVSALSLELDDASLNDKTEAEAFSELEEEGLIVDKLRRGDSTIWRITKTE